MAPLLTLTTDFGAAGPYVAALKGVILSVNREAVIVDISHDVEPQDVSGGAFVLGEACRYFPAGTIHVAVVDPGVGGARRGVAVKTREHVFVAPDNGLLSYVLDAELGGNGSFPGGYRALGAGVEAVELAERRFWREPVSATFHGRDIFAPVAAYLSLGVALEQFGKPLEALVSLALTRAERTSAGLRGRVVYTDHFGNLVTDVRPDQLPGEGITVEVAGRRISGLSTSYESGGDLLAIVGSSRRLEIAARNSSAARLLGARVGDEVRVIF